MFTWYIKDELSTCNAGYIIDSSAATASYHLR